MKDCFSDDVIVQLLAAVIVLEGDGSVRADAEVGGRLDSVDVSPEEQKLPAVLLLFLLHHGLHLVAAVAAAGVLHAVRRDNEDGAFRAILFAGILVNHISEAIIKHSYIPVFCGVGGGTTRGLRTIGLAKDVESQGAMGVVMNAPITNLNLAAVAAAVDIPVIITVTKADTDIEARLAAGASIINVACAGETPNLVRFIREKNAQVPIIASGGPTNDSIRATIEAGANAVTYTPPSTAELFKAMMSNYRE